MPNSNGNSNKFAVPAAIIIAGLIIAGAIFYERKSSSPKPAAEPTTQDQTAGINPSPLDNLKPLTEKDHLLGNPEAAVTLVLFSDLECFFCKRFHLTVKQLMDEYGKAGKLKVVFRHFPLDIHPKAKNEAIATECSADLGGNEKFWQYLDRLFEITPSNNGLDPKELPNIAEYVGLNRTRFDQCLVSGKFDQRIAEDSEDALKSGGLGTPYGILIGPKGNKTAIPGALLYSDVKKEIDEMLK